MSNNFLLSSPIASGYSNNYNEQPTNLEPLDSLPYDGKKSSLTVNATLKKKLNNYPTPFPSSSTGRSSSPIKAGNHSDSNSDEDFDSSFVMPESELDSSNKDIDMVIPQTVLPVEKSPSKKKTQHKYKIFPRVINIEIDPLNTSKLIIGRKKNLCDILLPGMRKISRKHAIISYIPERNQIRLECIGINGIIIKLPRKLSCFLIKPIKGMPVYELAGKETIRMLQQRKQFDFNIHKELFKSQNVTAFVLNPGESVLMPFVNNTIIDFKQVKTSLSMKEMETETFIELDENDIQSTDSMPESSKVSLSEAKNISTLSKLTKDIITPNSSFVIREPKTPTKKHESLLNSSFIGSQQHLASHLNNALIEAASTSFNKKLDKKPTTSHKRKLGTASLHNPKENKRVKTETERPIAEILQSLNEKNINIEELQNILANHLAFANILQTPLSQLRNTSSLIKTLSIEELRAILSNGKCIGVIFRQGKDAAGKPLEEEYFYDMENDDDAERKSLVTAMKGGRSGLRSCRKTHKQYFWKKPAK